MKRKLTAILCADVVGYSALISEDEEGALNQLLAYREVFDEIIDHQGGRIFNTAGDAVLAEFPSAVDAVRAAIDIQESLRTRNMAYPASRQMSFRIGITVGDVVEHNGDLLGDAVNIAARLETLADPGGICMSKTVQDQVSNKLSAHFRDIGPQKVKNIPQTIHAVKIELSGGSDKPDKPVANVIDTKITAAIAAGLAILVIATIYLLVIKEQSTDNMVEPTPAPTVSMAGQPLQIAKIPFICDSCRDQITRLFAKSGNHRAIAINDFGSYGAAAGFKTVKGAKNHALKRCISAVDSPCEIYSIDDKLVWNHPAPQMPKRPWVSPGAATRDFSPKDLVMLSQQARDAIKKQYQSAASPKALAISEAGHWFYKTQAATDEEAMRIALEGCSFNSRDVCQIIALNNIFIDD